MFEAMIRVKEVKKAGSDISSSAGSLIQLSAVLVRIGEKSSHRREQLLRLRD